MSPVSADIIKQVEELQDNLRTGRRRKKKGAFWSELFGLPFAQSSQQTAFACDMRYWCHYSHTAVVVAAGRQLAET